MRPELRAFRAARLYHILAPILGAPRQALVYAAYPDPGNAQPPSAAKMAAVLDGMRQSVTFDLAVTQTIIALVIEPVSAADFAHLVVKVCLADYARHDAKKKIHLKTREAVLTTLSAEVWQEAKTRLASIEVKDHVSYAMDLWLKLFAFYMYQVNHDPQPPRLHARRLLSAFHYPLLPLPVGELPEFFTKIAKECDPNDAIFKRPLGMTMKEFVKTNLDQIAFDARLTMCTSVIATLSALACSVYIVCYDFEMQVLLAFLVSAIFVMADIFHTVYHCRENPALELGKPTRLSRIEHWPRLHTVASWLACLSWQRGAITNSVRFSRYPWEQVYKRQGELDAEESEKPWGFPFDAGDKPVLKPNGEIPYQTPTQWISKAAGEFAYDEKQVLESGRAVYPVYDADRHLLFFAAVTDPALHDLLYPLLLHGVVGPQHNGFKRSYDDFQSWLRGDCSWLIRLNEDRYPEVRRCQKKGGEGYPLFFFDKEAPPKPADSEPKKTL